MKNNQPPAPIAAESTSGTALAESIPDGAPLAESIPESAPAPIDSSAPAPSPDQLSLPGPVAEPSPNPAPESTPLTAVSANRTTDANRRAKELAERRLNQELAAKKGFLPFRKLKSSLLREYYIEKYRKQALSEIINKQAGEESTLSDQDWLAADAATSERFTKAYRENYDNLIHDEAGESLAVDEKATAAAKDIISSYASGQIDLAAFTAQIQTVRDMTAKAGEIRQDNYLELANTAKARFEHGEAVQDIMQGFAVLNAEVRGGIRSEAHRSAIDKLVTSFESMKSKTAIANLVPTEFIAAGASIGLWAAQTGSKTIARAIPVGGILASSGIAALKEGSRVSTDRAQRQAELAQGAAPGESAYDQQIGETMYNMYKAADLTAAIESAAQSDNPDNLISSILKAESIIKATDTKGNDYIAYSAPDQIESERFALDLAIAEAKAHLSPEAREKYTQVSAAETAASLSALEKDTAAKDAIFKKLRRKRMAAAGLKTAAASAVFMFGSQELISAFSPNHYGLADKFLHLENNADAKHTLLADLLGAKSSTPAVPESIPETLTGLTKAEVAAFQGDPSAQIITNENIVYKDVSVGIPKILKQFGTNVHRTDWGANGTKVFDANELRAYMTKNGKGIVTGMFGDSGTWANGNINFAEAAAAGKINAYVSLTEGTQSTPIKLIGKLLPDGQLKFVPEPGSAAADCFKDGQFVGKFFEIAYTDSAEKGAENIIPLATLVGQGLDDDAKFNTTKAITKTTFDVVRTVAQEVASTPPSAPAETAAMLGVPLPFNSRSGLTYGTKTGNQPPAPTPEQPPTAPSPAEPTPDFHPPALATIEPSQPPVPGTSLSTNLAPTPELAQPGTALANPSDLPPESPDVVDASARIYDESGNLEEEISAPPTPEPTPGPTSEPTPEPSPDQSAAPTSESAPESTPEPAPTESSSESSPTPKQESPSPESESPATTIERALASYVSPYSPAYIDTLYSRMPADQRRAMEAGFAQMTADPSTFTAAWSRFRTAYRDARANDRLTPDYRALYDYWYNNIRS